MNYYKLAFYVIFAVSVLLNIFLFKGCENNKQIAESNSNLISGIKPREVTYTTLQFQEYQRQADSTAKANGIQTKIIKKYIYIHDTLKFLDTVKNEELGQPMPEDEQLRIASSEDKCYSATVFSYPDSSIFEVSYPLDLEIFDYSRHTYTPFVRRLWLWDFSKISEVKAVNNCNGEVINIEKNINVIKR